MPSWMVAIDSSVRSWAEAGRPGKGSFQYSVVQAEVESAWREGAPTAEVVAYVKRRIAHYSSPLFAARHATNPAA